MKTIDADGQQQAAKKKTTVLTNSSNLVEVLSQAQRKGLHKHRHLVGGRASACEGYLQKFVEFIVDSGATSTVIPPNVCEACAT